jgi:hypothetical protein
MLLVAGLTVLGLGVFYVVMSDRSYAVCLAGGKPAFCAPVRPAWHDWHLPDWHLSDWHTSIAARGRSGDR